MNAAAIASIGIDLGNAIFHLVALDCHAASGLWMRIPPTFSELIT